MYAYISYKEAALTTMNKLHYSTHIQDIPPKKYPIIINITLKHSFVRLSLLHLKSKASLSKQKKKLNQTLNIHIQNPLVEGSSKKMKYLFLYLIQNIVYSYF